jgi:hypothetical protein
MRDLWLKVDYFIAAGMATVGWLWLIVWVVLQVI